MNVNNYIVLLTSIFVFLGNVATNIAYVRLGFAPEGALIRGHQGGRTWQLFVGSKNGNANFRQARIYNFRVKCVVFARNRKFAKLTQ